MGAIALGVVGVALGAGGTAMSASAAGKKRDALLRQTEEGLPTPGKYTEDYYGDLSKYAGQSASMARNMNQDIYDQVIGRREQYLPGTQASLQDASKALFPLLQGKLPPEVLANFQRSGNANSVGLGFGGSGFGDLNTALFGARGQLAGMQLGYSLLPSLLGAVPNAPMMTPDSFLNNIMTPTQRTQTQLNIRGQNIGIQTAAAGMPTGNEIWGKYLSGTGGMLTGAALGGMGGMGGGMSSAPSGVTGSGWTGGGTMPGTYG